MKSERGDQGEKPGLVTSKRVCAVAALTGMAIFAHALTMDSAAEGNAPDVVAEQASTSVPETTVTTVPETTTTTKPAATTTTAPPPPPSQIKQGSIYIVGDSIMAGIDQDLGPALAAEGWNDQIIRAAPSRPLQYGTPTFNVEAVDPGNPDNFVGTARIEQPEDVAQIAESRVVVVELGTNDYTKDPAMIGQVATGVVNRIKTINPESHVYWVNTYIEGKSGDEAINQALAGSGATIIDYASVAPGKLLTDDIHPNQEGQAALMGLIVDSVGEPR